jgi:hypothetical protein
MKKEMKAKLARRKSGKMMNMNMKSNRKKGRKPKIDGKRMMKNRLKTDWAEVEREGEAEPEGKGDCQGQRNANMLIRMEKNVKMKKRKRRQWRYVRKMR